ncbi:hypothetical protein MASSI9I_10178 [Massilia sp. 9I]|nr:hypothetical protein MASSI9I_10178 [Massilia sp. 9I]
MRKLHQGGGLQVVLRAVARRAQGGGFAVRFDGNHLHAVLLKQLHGLVGGIGIGDHGGHAVQAAQDQAGLARELRAVGQHHQFLGLADQALLGLDQERIGFHQSQQREAVDAHEHLGGVVVLGDVVVEGREDNVLLAVDAAARHDDLVLARYQQALGHQEGVGEDLQVLIGEELGHHEGGRAAVDDDRFAVGAHAGGMAGDGALARRIALNVVLEGFAGERELARLRQQVLGAAAGAGEQVATSQPTDVATDRRRGCVEPFDKLLDRCRLVLGKQLQQTLAAFVIHHVVSSESRLFWCGVISVVPVGSRYVGKVLSNRYRSVNHKMINTVIICLRCNAQTRKSINSVIDCDLVSKLIDSALTPFVPLLSTVSRCRITACKQDMEETHRPLGSMTKQSIGDI